MNLRDQRLEAPARRLINNFGALPEVGPYRASTVTRVISESAHLIRQLNAAIAASGLRRFDLFDPSVATGGYEADLRTIRIPAPVLDEPDETETAYLLGHELQHALNAAGIGHHDLTAALSDLAAERSQESRALIAAWNALVDHLRAHRPDLTLRDLSTASPDRAASVVIMAPGGIIIPRANLMINDDLTIDPSPANLEAMAQNYADQCQVVAPYEGYPQVGV